MLFTVKKEQLLNAVLMAERIVGKKESLLVLSCILLRVEKDISISATNLESAIEIHVEGSVGEKGVLAVPAHILSQTLRSITADTITLKNEEGNLLIQARAGKTLIKAVPHTEFPILPETEKEKSTISIPQDTLLRGIQSVSYAASGSMIRPELGSIYMLLKDRSIVFAATDSFRLSERTIPESSVVGKGVEILLPLKHTIELSHILDHTKEEKINITLEDAHFTASMGGIRFISRVIEGTFPNYKDIIPKKYEVEATLLKADFAEVMRKARVFAGSEQNVGVHVYPKKKIMSVTAQSGDIGEMSDDLEAALSGSDLDINFHIDYLSDCLQSIEADSMHFKFAGTGKPLVITSAGGEGFTYLVMPLNR